MMHYGTWWPDLASAKQELNSNPARLWRLGDNPEDFAQDALSPNLNIYVLPPRALHLGEQVSLAKFSSVKLGLP